MKLIIDIHERDYQSIRNGHVPFSILHSIQNGTPLPKGHGRLIDADDFQAEMQEKADDYFPEGRLSYGYRKALYHNVKEIEKRPTIIEADKEE